MTEVAKYPRSVAELKVLIEEEKTAGDGKVRSTCKKCRKRFYAVNEDPDQLRGRPREYCGTCRLKNLREWRKKYDKDRKAKKKAKPKRKK